MYFRMAAHSMANRVGAGANTTIFDSFDRARQYKQGLIEQHGYTDSEITILAADKDGSPIRA